MALIKAKPTSPGRRFVVKAKSAGLHKGEPYEPLLEKKTRKGGRNNAGRITTRHRGGGHKQRYRVVDFKRDKDGVPGRVERIEYDPNRSAHLALVLYADGERRYIIAPKGVSAGDEVMSGASAAIKPGNSLPLRIMSGASAAIKPGNSLPLRNIPLGTVVHCVELKPSKGAQVARSAGAGVQLIAREGVFATLRLRSGELRRVRVDCRATVGEVGNSEHGLESTTPTVAAKADHPAGGIQ
jgi:large subunit ribosomal protein L2